MKRTIHELLVAAAAGDSLTKPEAARLTRHQASIPEAFDEDPMLEELGSLKAKRVHELRRLVRELATQILEQRALWGELFRNPPRRARRPSWRHADLGRSSGKARRTKAKAIVRRVEAIRKKNPALTATAAVMKLLKQIDAAWPTYTAQERANKVAAFMRRRRRSRKKSPDTNVR